MTTVLAYARQSLIDVALMACGSVDYAYDIAKANGLPLTTVLAEPTELLVPAKPAGAHIPSQPPCTGTDPDTPASDSDTPASDPGAPAAIGTAVIGSTLIIS